MIENQANSTSSSIVKQYQNSFATYGDTPAGVMWPRGRQIIRFDALTRHFNGEGFSVLDYGCGLGHLKQFLDERFKRYKYFGVDLVPEFINNVHDKYPDACVQLVENYLDVSTPVDHVVISGAFNIVDAVDQTYYLQIINATLLHLFSLTRISLAVNFMTDRVDFVQDGAMHMNVEKMASFLRLNLSPRIIIDESYMPYEFTIVILKDSQIIKPDNIYNSL